MNLRFVDGDLFNSKCEVWVNTVNCFGVMGKGIAKEFKFRFPDYFIQYKKDCERGLIGVGKPTIHFNGNNPRYIISFPTKYHWSKPSKFEWVKDGLVHLKHLVEVFRLQSIAMPALGCQNGGLDFKDIKPLIQQCHSLLYPNLVLDVYNPRG